MTTSPRTSSVNANWEDFDQKRLEDSISSIEMKPVGPPETPVKKKKRKESVLPIKDYESLDYDHCVNVPYKQWLESYTKFTYWHISFMRWIMVGLIGFFTGLTAYLINVGIHFLTILKYDQFKRVYDLTEHSGTIVYGLLVLVGFNVVYALIAGILVGIEPIAAGSGIPEIKCYLNGVRMPRVSRLRTLVAKAVGVLFSVAGGFLVGKEGPMIHSGSIIGAGIPQLRTFLFGKARIPYEYFRSDRDKRDFVSCGAAAGVAAAFGAPIGGVLFSLEEGSSFWDQGLTWRSLFCAMCSTLTLNFFLSGTPGLVDTPRFGQLDQPGLIDFGRFYQQKGTNFWSLEYLALFVVMGAIGGLMGAWFNSLNTQLTKYRMKHVFRKNVAFKVMEAILIATVTTVSIFILATFLGTCVPVLEQVNNDKNFEDTTKPYFCPVGVTYTDSTEPNYGSYGKFYNDMGTIVFNSQEDAIQELFHQNGAFTLPTLGLTLIVYFFIACWTYGSGIPSGLFVPCLTIGALYGRFFITALWSLDLVPCIYPGTFALIGAAAFLGGVVRMTVSLTVILIESTDEIEYGLPLLVTLMVAKWVGDLFNEGLYDIHIELKEVPFLGWDSPENMNRLTAADVMNTDLKYVYPITRVRSIESLLRVTAHNAFFVMSPLNVKRSYLKDMVARNDDSDIIETPMRPQLYERLSILPTNRVKALEQQRRLKFGATNINSDSMRTPLVATTPVNYQAADQNNDALNNLVLHGVILRHQLVELLRNKIFFEESEGPGSQPQINHLSLNTDYPRFKGIFDVHLTDSERQMLLDVSLYMNPCPYTISHHASLPRVFNLFRTMGLRHLPVIEDSGVVVGMITRHDLTHQHLHAALHRKQEMAAEVASHTHIDFDDPSDGVLDTGYRSRRSVAESITEDDSESATP